MTREELTHEYFEWMCQLVYSERCSRIHPHHKLLNHLHSREFYYILDMDSNRYEDGIELRYRFGYEQNYPGDIISLYLDDRPCSVLEMMVALSTRCEEHIMSDPDIGNRTGQWFWSMIKSLGLESMDDANFDSVYTDMVISKFLNRTYERTGKGGLFTIEGCRRDLRDVEIWCQMMWYIGDI